MPAYCLSIHAEYRCRHAGVCCTAGWPIPIEPEKVRVLRSRGLLGPDAAACRGERAPATLHKTSDGACVFFTSAPSRLCTIHRDIGERVMPAACRNFPRIGLKDPRGTFVTLSHVCPTAARLLLSAGPVGVVEAPATITLSGEVDALDATTVLPPLLRADMLTDWDGYTAWERASLAVLDDGTYSPRAALSIISAATSEAARWSPGDRPLAAHVTKSFERARWACTPDTARAPFAHPVKAFLAAHLFASWLPYTRQAPSLRRRSGHAVRLCSGHTLRGSSGHALGAIVARLELALTLVGDHHDSEESFVEAVRHADLRLRHEADHHTEATSPACAARQENRTATGASGR